ncbi:2-phosphosulfolactate phosphatase family protein [Clostridium tyrobutyricum]|uniref:2-phosphosulfolactate phosphatase family protein n=1 Tax=Clostridium tyrobutyricum TaxID=1519 RepID=UPI001C389BB2|nr:2-phosphosulfolactate phosphatase family protein [Clostridium tyrobutyricum]MBV4419762.1 2-phosphosulfolactate phosphatase family protein [Clostridium tyrobutyricum]
MNIDIIISADDIKEDNIKNKSVVVIDMLRATSVIITAINNGCKEVIPVLNIDEAVDIVSSNRNKYILGGERNAVKIKGFDFSNSPLEYKSNVVKDKTLVMTTTNGTKAIKNSSAAKNILIGAMINAKAVASKLVDLNNDIVIVNAGTNGQFSIDDFICAGYIIENIMRITDSIITSDIATTAKYIYDNNKTIISFIKYAKHYKVIKNLKLDKDLEYCCQKDIVSIVPEYENGSIINKK